MEREMTTEEALDYWKEKSEDLDQELSEQQKKHVADVNKLTDDNERTEQELEELISDNQNYLREVLELEKQLADKEEVVLGLMEELEKKTKRLEVEMAKNKYGDEYNEIFSKMAELEKQLALLQGFHDNVVYEEINCETPAIGILNINHLIAEFESKIK